MKDIRVVELFAGVGGFRLGLEASSPRYKVIWANQWEPSTKKQHAFDCYVSHFTSGEHINKDIAEVRDDIPEHDLLVGGFPCQDYSVASTGAKGIEGKKGVLWWDIEHIIRAKRPVYILLENVDRLLKSPAKQRGRDFAIILSCLNRLGYIVEWRVINAAEYGYAQKRRRVFILAYKKDSPLGRDYDDEILLNRIFSTSRVALDVRHSEYTVGIESDADILATSKSFSGTFHNSGIASNGHIMSQQVTPMSCEPTPLSSVLEQWCDDDLYITDAKRERWEYLKGRKSIERTRPDGGKYTYSEGNMSFPDPLNIPARTILTSESSVNRSSHVIADPFSGERLRVLTPIECERLQGFPDNWTATGMPRGARYFCMGNALVVPLIGRIGKELINWI